MNREETHEALDLVADLNNEIFLNDNYSGFPIYEFESTGEESVIKYLGLIIWSSEDDEREYDDFGDDYEPLRGFLVRECQKISKQLQEQMQKLKTYE